MISRIGIPSQEAPFCSDQMKAEAIKSYLRSIGWKNYYTAIGIRTDEIDRMSDKRVEKRIIYPLVTMCATDKPGVNRFWRDQPFRLLLKGYQGNCRVCWKKSLRILITIAKEDPSAFDFVKRMQDKYENFVPEGRENKLTPPLRFFRGNLRAEDIIEMSKQPFKPAEDTHIKYRTWDQLEMFNFELDAPNGCSESCEVFK